MCDRKVPFYGKKVGKDDLLRKKSWKRRPFTEKKLEKTTFYGKKVGKKGQNRLFSEKSWYHWKKVGVTMSDTEKKCRYTKVTF